MATGNSMMTWLTPLKGKGFFFHLFPSKRFSYGFCGVLSFIWCFKGFMIFSIGSSIF